jgi:putative hydrolase of the HAD superfamily
MIQAVLFDLFGTLVDSDLYISPYSDLMLSMDLNDDERTVARLLYLTTPLDTVEEAAGLLEQRLPGRRVSPEAIRQAESDFSRHEESFAWMDGAREVLRELRQEGYRLGLVSNLTTPYKRTSRRLGIEELVDQLAYSCDVGAIKPARALFEAALGPLGVPSHQAVMVGDTYEADILGARRAGLKAILVDPAEEDGARSIRQVPGLVRSLHARR